MVAHFLAFRRLRQEDCGLEARLSYMVRPSIKKKKKKRGGI
jgi:hypothetical protein